MRANHKNGVGKWIRFHERSELIGISETFHLRRTLFTDCKETADSKASKELKVKAHGSSPTRMEDFGDLSIYFV